MPRRMEHYDTAEWQPYLIAAAAGAVLIMVGIGLMVQQLVVSVRNRRAVLDLTGDPWNGRTLEWLTSSPPAPYNFAVLPEVRDIDAFTDMKRRGVAYQRPARYTDIFLPRNSAIGPILGIFAFVLGFAMVWHIWWLAIVGGLAILIAVAVRSSDDDTEYRMPAADVAATEDRRRDALARAPQDADDPAFLPQPQPRGAT
jgi:cytochrome o ubiquinol oxidase subunit 1